MKKLIRLFVFTLPIIFWSCDFFSTSSIVNSTEENLFVEIHYDKKQIRKDWNEDFSFNELFVKKNSQKYKLVKVDTLNYLIEFKVLPKDTLEVDVNRGKIPVFDYLKEIKIYGRDTILLDKKEEMSKVFRKMENGKFIFVIK